VRPILIDASCSGIGQQERLIPMDLGCRWMNALSRKLMILAGAVAMASAASAQDIVWSKHYGGVYNEGGYAFVQTPDGGYAAVGSTFSYGAGDHDVYLIRTDSLGDTLWSRTYGGPLADYGHDILIAPDSGFIMVGTTLSFGRGKEDLYLIRTNRWGDLLWSRTYGGAQTDEGWSIRATRNGGYIVCGTTASLGKGYGDLWLLRLNAVGDSLWAKTFGGAGGESGFAVRETPDGGFIAVGCTGSFGEGYSSIYTVKVSSSGDSLWARTYGGAKADVGYAIENTLDLGYIIAGSTASFGLGYSDAYIVKLDGFGNVEWQNTFGGIKDDRAYAVCPTIDGGYVLAGTTESFGAGGSDQYIVKVDPLGYSTWTKTFGGHQADYCRAVGVNRAGALVLAGYTYSFSAGGSDLYVSTVSTEGATDVYEPLEANLPSGFTLDQNYPNPFNMTTRIEFTLPRRSEVTLTIYNLLGQVARTYDRENLPAGSFSVEWDGASEDGRPLASGIYFYRLVTTDFAASRKMVLLK